MFNRSHVHGHTCRHNMGTADHLLQKSPASHLIVWTCNCGTALEADSCKSSVSLISLTNVSTVNEMWHADQHTNRGAPCVITCGTTIICQYVSATVQTHVAWLLHILLWEEMTCSSEPTAPQSHRCCWLVCFPVGSILEAAQGGGGPAPDSHPDAHTPAEESDTHPAAAPRRGRRPGPLCSPVWRVITEMSQVLQRRSWGLVYWKHSF